MIVTIINGEIINWTDRETAINTIERQMCFADNSYIISQLKSGSRICTDREYDQSVMLKAKLALGIGVIYRGLF